MNATSSGRIGVASTVTNFKKQEKLEIVAYAKKQEEFMMDANLVCIKLASTHPFIFIRQIPMMEGLLQGRVVYSFEEFKRRKFDKLFHYIADLLNMLLPYVFHREYFFRKSESSLCFTASLFLAGRNRLAVSCRFSSSQVGLN